MRLPSTRPCPSSATIVCSRLCVSTPICMPRFPVRSLFLAHADADTDTFVSNTAHPPVQSLRQVWGCWGRATPWVQSSMRKL